jgi:hypothetical protein
MQTLALPAQGTVLLVQGGLALLALAFGVKWIVKRVRPRKSGD